MAQTPIHWEHTAYLRQASRAGREKQSVILLKQIKEKLVKNQLVFFFEIKMLLQFRITL